MQCHAIVLNTSTRYIQTSAVQELPINENSPSVVQEFPTNYNSYQVSNIDRSKNSQ